MQIYLAVTPAEAQEASRFRCSLAHVAYCIGPDSTLLRQNLLLQTRGGLLSVSRPGRALYRQPGAAVGRRAAGVRAAELRRRTAGFRAASCAGPAGLCRRRWPGACRRRPVYVPESYAAASGAIPLICTAISGGNFVQRLQEAAAGLGQGRRSGPGCPAAADGLHPPGSKRRRPPSRAAGNSRTCWTEKSPSVFFSQDLCARYFTYARDGETHFVLFDDADTLSQKLRTGGNMGFAAAFLMYPEVQDLLPKLFPRAAGHEKVLCLIGTALFLDRSIIALLVLASGLRLLAALDAGALIMLSLPHLRDDAGLGAAALETASARCRWTRRPSHGSQTSIFPSLRGIRLNPGYFKGHNLWL